MDKRCSRCKTFKPINQFCKDRSRKDGLNGNCLSCRQEKNLINKELKNKISREWHYKNKDKANARRKKWSLENSEKRNAKEKRYRKENPEKYRNKNLTYRTKKYQNGIFQISKNELKMLYSSECFYCGSKDKIQIDHVIPISRGGRHAIGNLVSSCFKCNAQKNNKLIVEWKSKKNRETNLIF